MARQARVRSMTGIYHVMLKGIDSRNIFMDDEDKMLSTRGRFYCALCWLKNTEQSVWKSFRWWLRFPTFVCFQSVAPVSQLLISLKNLNSPTSPIFLK